MGEETAFRRVSEAFMTSGTGQTGGWWNRANACATAAAKPFGLPSTPS